MNAPLSNSTASSASPTATTSPSSQALQRFLSDNAFQAEDFQRHVAEDVRSALREDLGADLSASHAERDLTAQLIAADKRMQARILLREDAVLCGRPWVEETLRQIAPEIQLHWLAEEGEACHAEQVVATFEGPAQLLLSAERTMLNFMQLLSGVASKTQRFVAACAAVPGSHTAIVDTRKTLPGLRVAQKYAVHVGGGVNHRMGLFDAILIKENHIASAGSIAKALAKTQQSKARFVEIEVERLSQLEEALDAGAKMVLLDNMDIATLEQAVAINAKRGSHKAVLEISGGVQYENIARLAQTGVDRISIGALTKDVKATDFSMRFAGT